MVRLRNMWKTGYRRMLNKQQDTGFSMIDKKEWYKDDLIFFSYG